MVLHSAIYSNNPIGGGGAELYQFGAVLKNDHFGIPAPVFPSSTLLPTEYRFHPELVNSVIVPRPKISQFWRIVAPMRSHSIESRCATGPLGENGAGDACFPIPRIKNPENHGNFKPALQ
jgi:hypothetical protein